jgi:hypothetical protein
MSLKLLQPGVQPLGQFDGVDSEVLTFKGGEICTFSYVTTSGQPGVTTPGLDQAAYDQFDGYVNVSGTFKRPAVTKTFAATSMVARPLMLADDGIAGYGTLFGSVVGGAVGQQVSGGAVLGPHTATGSGKMTCWDKPGLYAVSLDAVNTAATTGLQPTNTSLVGGDVLGLTTAGLLTPTATGTGAGAPVTNGGNAVVVGRLVEFNTNQSLVTTPNYLVAALNSPSGNVSSERPRAFQFATIYFAPQSN